jgi:hypothetical protein
VTGLELPSALDLTRPQFDGWACVWCGIPLMGMEGVTSAGRAEGRMGAHDMSVEVYACPACAIAHLRPPPLALPVPPAAGGMAIAYSGEGRAIAVIRRWATPVSAADHLTRSDSGTPRT